MMRFSRESRNWLKNDCMKLFQPNEPKWRLISAALFFVLVFASCEKANEDIGIGLQPEDQLLGLFQTDTTTILARTIREDSLRSDETSLNLIGSYTDPVFGTTKAGFVTQLRLSTVDQDFGTNPVVDSLVLTLEYADRWYGAITSQLFSAARITEDIYLDSTYYTNKEIATDGIELVAAGKGYQRFVIDDFVVLANEDSMPPHLRLRMSEDLGNQLMNLPAEAYADNDAFVNEFKGIRVQSLSDEGGIIPCDLVSGNSRMRLYYHNDTDTSRFDFTINTQSARYETFEHTFTGDLIPLMDGKTAGAGELGRIQAGSSCKLKLEFPFLENYNDFEGRTINRAELILPRTALYDSRFPSQELLFLLTENEDGDLVGLPDQLSTLTSIGGQYNSVEDAYIFNISRFVQLYLNGELNSKVLYAVSNNASVSVNRVEIVGPESLAEDKMRLILTYSN